jgi:hypothetical protein
MDKIQKGHGNVENATGILDCNRERDTTLYKKRGQKKHMGEHHHFQELLTTQIIF